MRILIAKPHLFGDVLQGLYVARAARQAFPRSEIDFLCSAAYAVAFHGNQDVSRVLLLRKPGKAVSAVDAPVTLFDSERELLAELQGQGFDRVINLAPEAAFSQLVSHVPAGRRAGVFFSRTGDRELFGDLAVYGATCVAVRRLVRLNLVDLFALNGGLPLPTKDAPLWDTLGDEALADAVFQRHGLDRGLPLICLQPGSSDPFRRWPAADFARVADWLAARGLVAVVHGGPKEEPLCKAVSRQAACTPRCLLDLSLLELRALLGRCRLLITNDTGPMHLAAAVGTPTLALFFGPSSPVDTAAYRPGGLALASSLPCAPCKEPRECPRAFACRGALTPERVQQVLESLDGLASGDLAGSGPRIGDVQIFRAEREPALGLLEQERLRCGMTPPGELIREFVADSWLSVWLTDPKRRQGFLAQLAGQIEDALDDPGRELVARDLLQLAREAERARAEFGRDRLPVFCSAEGPALTELMRVLPSCLAMAPGEGRSFSSIATAFLELLARDAPILLRQGGIRRP